MSVKYKEWLKDENLIKVKGRAMEGLSNEQIAHNMGVNPDTLYTWKKRFSEFDEALKRGKEVADFEVENALFKSAIGFEYQEKVEEVMVVDGKKTQHKKIITKYSPPNPTSAIFWLKNRKPDLRMDRKAQDLNLKSEGPLIISGADDLED